MKGKKIAEKAMEEISREENEKKVQAVKATIQKIKGWIGENKKTRNELCKRIDEQERDLSRLKDGDLSIVGKYEGGNFECDRYIPILPLERAWTIYSERAGRNENMEGGDE